MEDEIIRVLPVHYSNKLGTDLQLHQFPLQTHPLQAPPSAIASGKRISARLKPNARRIEIHIPADTRSDVWNPQRAKELGAAQLEDDHEKNQEQKTKESEEPRLSEVRLKSEEIPQHGAYMLGILRDGHLHLHPISELHRFTPTLTHLDVQSRKNKRSKTGAGSDSESDDGPPADPDETPVISTSKGKEKKPVEMREINVSTRKTDDKGTTVGMSMVRREMLQIIRAEEEEDWQNYEYCDVATTASREALTSVFSQTDTPLEYKTNMATFLKDIPGL
ncbi:hypothetical protein AX15_007189 [Amanita polypyramis BW_CC]|nr:hypothetical protein AX15_007189 [Amanita polypyramis BW_CC]